MTESASTERKRSRSPGYPNFGLPEAIRKAELLYRHDKRNAVSREVAATHWGYSPSSSAVLLSIATLKKFGMLEEAGSGASRLVRLTDVALNILLSTNGSAEWRELIKTAALAPPIHAELWEQYGDELPSDTNLKRILILEKGFNDAAASDLIREYKETISFSGVKRESIEPELLALPAPIESSNTTVTSRPTVAPMPMSLSQNMHGLRQYRFPLIESLDAELWLPVPLTEENFELLKEQLDAFVKVTRRALIAKESNRHVPSPPAAD